ncbi:Lipid transfer protein/Par allergen [Parasponia andersonii]|uniref:Lipid transfer protein/Par allergen n=1 Tax=Parasponia andersonii TaxID=3476 RepID=A0A2P5BS22_PARAD|nr:Lipid transfer protein/Par allergen [Parasponia andersonii]
MKGMSRTHLVLNKLLIIITYVVVVCMVAHAPIWCAACSCEEVKAMVAPCLPFLRGSGNSAPNSCCTSLIRLRNTVSTTTVRLRNACECLKKATRLVRGLKNGRLQSLNSRCRLNLSFVIRPDINCNSIR